VVLPQQAPAPFLVQEQEQRVAAEKALLLPVREERPEQLVPEESQRLAISLFRS
jgi:hypothetical protein